jgi:hypothetical protein
MNQYPKFGIKKRERRHRSKSTFIQSLMSFFIYLLVFNAFLKLTLPYLRKDLASSQETYNKIYPIFNYTFWISLGVFAVILVISFIKREKGSKF